MEKPYYVHAVWDEEARVWVASSEDLPGLATESETAEALVENSSPLFPSCWRSMGAPTLSRLRSNFSPDASNSRRDAEFTPQLTRLPLAAGCRFVRQERAIAKSGTARSPRCISLSIARSSLAIRPTPCSSRPDCQSIFEHPGRPD